MKENELLVLRIITRLNIGGPAIHSIILTKGLENLHFFVNKKKYIFKTILITGSEDKEEGNMITLRGEKMSNLIKINQLRRNINLINDIIAFIKIYKIIKKLKPVIVHTHMAKAGMLGRVAAKLCRTPIILHTFHGNVFSDYFSNFKSRLIIEIEKQLAKISTCIITLSPRLKEALINYNIAEKNKIKVIPLGLELDKFFCCEDKRGALRKELNISLNCIIVGIVARLVPIKAHTLFLEAAKLIVSNKYDKNNIKFLIVGDGYLKETLKRYADKLNLSQYVIFLGWRNDLDKIYADIDILVLVSLNEGLPVCIIEGMAAGKPTVATDVGGVADLVVSDQTGIIVPKQNPIAIKDAICKLINDEALRKNMGSCAKKYANKYTAHSLIENIKNFYSELFVCYNYFSKKLEGR